MRKYTVILLTSICFVGSFQALGSDDFEMGAISDSVISKLWKGHFVPEEEVNDFFSLVAEHSNDKNKKKVNIDREVAISEWQTEIIEYLKARHEKDPKKYDAIEDFSTKTRNEKSFSDNIISKGLQIILQSY